MMAKKVGAGEFKDFAQYLPQLIAGGKNLAMSYKDTAGMFAYMTAKGQSATDSAMLMNNAFTALQKNEVMKGLKNKGIDLFDSKGMRRNIKDVFLELTKKLNGLNDRKKSQFFIDIGLNDAQAKTAFSVLTSDAERFNEIMGDVNDSVGETDRQLSMTANRARSWGDIGDEIKSWGVAIGDFVLPVMDQFVTLINNAVKGWKSILSFDFKSPDEKAQEKYLEQNTMANKLATKYTSSYFKKDLMQTGMTPGSKEDNVWKIAKEKYLEEILKSDSKSKNNIDKKESAAALALKNVNNGKSAFDTSGSSSSTSSSGSSVSGDGNKVRNLTMNLYITNNNKVDDANHLEKLKQKITDVIVDSARDGMVTIGV
jgi:hypothetical protein